MFRKMLPMVIIILVAITLIVIVAFILWNYLEKPVEDDPNSNAKQTVEKVKAKELSAEEESELTFEVDEILTNLANKDFIKLKLAFQLNNSDAHHEFELLLPKVKNAIIQTISDLTPEQVQGSKGQDAFLALLINKINTTILKEGKVTEISIVTFILS